MECQFTASSDASTCTSQLSASLHCTSPASHWIWPGDNCRSIQPPTRPCSIALCTRDVPLSLGVCLLLATPSALDRHARWIHISLHEDLACRCPLVVLRPHDAPGERQLREDAVASVRGPRHDAEGGVRLALRISALPMAVENRDAPGVHFLLHHGRGQHVICSAHVPGNADVEDAVLANAGIPNMRAPPHCPLLEGGITSLEGLQHGHEQLHRRHWPTSIGSHAWAEE
mmetsp:Transcript_48716/g.130403  ORF Transcript_48716/g.130403 Transcript_48716/m.130403 type:complete len:229 (-) Transcript_48716:490-1176(-)